jgi:hypothetical protein
MWDRLLSSLKANKAHAELEGPEPDPVFELLAPFFQVVEVDSGPFIAGESFRRKFAQDAPTFQHHLIAFYRKSWDHLVPMGYLNFRPFENTHLVGGGLTDGRSFDHLLPEHAEAITHAGGILYLMLRTGFCKFSPRCDGIFGHVGNPRALEVDLMAGFERTQHEKLVAFFPRPISNSMKQKMIAKINALGPF